MSSIIGGFQANNLAEQELILETQPEYIDQFQDRDNTGLFVLGGIVIIIVVLLIVFALKKK